MTSPRHLPQWDWKLLDKVLRMEGGYVLDFSDRTMGNFFADEFHHDINDTAYMVNGTSKANRLRTFVRIGPFPLVGQVLDSLLEYRIGFGRDDLTDSELAQYREIAKNLGGRGNSATFAAPITRVTLFAPPTAPEPELERAMYEHILEVCQGMVDVMERDPRPFAAMEEEHLRTQFLVPLNGHYKGGASGETFNYEGKTDILLRHEGKVIFVAECKFWRGPMGFTQTIDQLLGYTAWRDTKTAILLFNRNKDTSAVLAQIPGLLSAHPNFVRSENYPSSTGFRAVLRHRHDAERHLTLTVLVFDVPR